MANEERFDFESLQDRETVQAYLKALIDGIEKGRISLHSDEKEIEMFPCELLKFSLKAKRKPHSGNQLTVKIAWKEPGPDIDASRKSIRISS